MYADREMLLRRVDAHRMRELLLDFAAIASPPGDTAVAAEWYAGCLRASGAVETRILWEWPRTPSVVAGFPGVRRAPTLQICGHLDTVSLAPARAYGEAGRVFGRGVAWNKGGLIAAAEAARVLAASGPLPGGGVLVVAHSRHEAPAGDGRDLAALVARGIVGDAVLITTGDHALAPIASLAMGHFRVTYSHDERETGPRAHAACLVPLTAIETAQLFCAALHHHRQALARQADPLFGPETIAVTRIAGGDQIGVEPASCTVEGVWRWSHERGAEAVRAELTALAERTAARCGARVEVTLDGVREGFCLAPGERLMRCLCDAYRSVVGRDLWPAVSAFPGDAALFLAQARVVAVSHGLDASTAHTARESVAVDDLIRLARIYICLALDYLHGDFAADTERRDEAQAALVPSRWGSGARQAAIHPHRGHHRIHDLPSLGAAALER